jgi:hypothetical protein
MSDVTREELKSLWQSLIDGETTREDAVAWAQLHLSAESWTDEVTHKGLQLLNDRVHERWSTADHRVRERLLSVYGRWMDDVLSFERDPLAWKRSYALTFLRGLPGPMRARAFDQFKASGDLVDGDAVEFRL